MIIHFYLIPIVIIIAAGITVFGGNYFSNKFIIKKRTLSFEDLIVIMTTVVQNEINIYERSFFRHKGAITNANYENFYHDLTNRIFSALPKTFFDEMSRYITTEAAATIICEKVHSYLQEKAKKIV